MNLPRGKPTLLSALQALMGVQVAVEMKDDAEVSGTVFSVDSEMNIDLRDVRVTTAAGEELELPEMLVLGRSILFVHLPPQLDLDRTIRAHQRLLSSTARKTTRSKREAPARSSA